MRSTWKMAVCAVMSVAVAACGGDDGDSGDSGLDQARVARIDQTPHGLDQARLARIGRTLRVRFVVVRNAPSDCPADVAFGSCFDAKLVLTNTAEAWSARGWKIDFSMIRKVISV
ncbi:MAG TPA: carbohydate-binding domain-containing protein, partial [Polyangia bacterium]|nr:carbohydate-binding domain-containing protein [Polyangia bacterium]